MVAEGEQLRDKIGTPFYMAPEMLQSEPLYDPQQADVWSAGVVLFTDDMEMEERLLQRSK